MIRLLLLTWALYAGHSPAPGPRHRHEVCPGATYFYERHHPKPAWANKMVVVCTIENHVFLREAKEKEHE